ncbi:hypothetical protein CUC08_Gglean010373 [Alternaria sp. MG1]|nr:hypothetical protein CUC08_Gglean010373 [Alternaria sp. MG1]
MTAHIPYLPAEIHRIIAEYVHREDLPSYRLVNRQLCDMATEELFSTIVFHYSTASIDRLKRLGWNARLRGQVKNIFWDVNQWSVGNVRDFHEWEQYFTQIAQLDRWRNANYDSSGYTQLSQNRREWEAYLDRVADERKARVDRDSLQVLERFYNLHSIHIVNGDLFLAHRGLQKVAEDCPNASFGPVVFRRGFETYSLRNMPGIETLLIPEEYCKSSLKELTLNTVHFKCFAPLTSSNFDNLSSLDITIFPRTFRDRYLDTQWVVLMIKSFRRFLASSTRLECLRIDLNHEKAEPNSYDVVLSIDQVFDNKHTWSTLRTLSLCHFSATPDTLLSFLGRHSSTLKDLRLHNISWIVDNGDERGEPEQRFYAPSASVRHCAWPRVLQEMRKSLSLDHATVTGKLGENRHMRGWRLHEKDDELAAAVSDYLVRGGQCPLTADNADFDPESDTDSKREGSAA